MTSEMKPLSVGPLIGEGIEGQVYAAHSPTSGLELALKTFSTFRDYRSCDTPLEEEYRIAEQVAHPNIVQVYRDRSSRSVTPCTPIIERSPAHFSSGRSSSNGFLVMARVSGKDLDSTKVFSSPREQFKIALDFVEIHQHLLERGCWNLDLTSVNFIVNDGALVAIDIGSFADIPERELIDSATIKDVSMILFEIFSKRPRTIGWDTSIADSFGPLATAPLTTGNVEVMRAFLNQAHDWILRNTPA